MASLSGSDVLAATQPLAHPPARRPHIGIVVDPRFSGGTSAAVAAEMRALAPHADLEIFALETAMFKGRRINPVLQTALDELGLQAVWDAPVARAQTLVLHNPSCLKFDARPPMRLSCRSAYVVTHENFRRPGGADGFDVAHCLRLIERALVCGTRFLAPISEGNRRGVAAFVAETGADWRVADFDWTNVFDLPLRPPVPAPRDRRGRHSRPGFEKFPSMEVMRAHFPPQAERCAILGGDGFLAEGAEAPPRHWQVRRFGEVPVARFLEEIDFFVYFTSPAWRESFGRVIVEAIAAGKVVITDPGTAETFGAAVVASDGGDVDAIIAGFVAEPRRYGEFVRAAQATLERFRPGPFARKVIAALSRSEVETHVLL